VLAEAGRLTVVVVVVEPPVGGLLTGGVVVVVVVVLGAPPGPTHDCTSVVGVLWLKATCGSWPIAIGIEIMPVRPVRLSCAYATRFRPPVMLSGMLMVAWKLPGPKGAGVR